MACLKRYEAISIAKTKREEKQPNDFLENLLFGSGLAVAGRVGRGYWESLFAVNTVG